MSEGEVWGEIEPALGSDYRQSIEFSSSYKGAGLAATLLYVHGGGRSKLKSAYDIGGLYGVNTRIVDDVLDGDWSHESIQDREQFLENYLDSVETGTIPEYIEYEEEKSAYCAGSLLHDMLSADAVSELADHFKSMKQPLLEEDKSTPEGYETYIHTAGGNSAEGMVKALGTLDGFNPSETIVDGAHDMGVLLQVADDKLDDDDGLSAEWREHYYQEALEQVEQHHGTIPFIVRNALKGYAAVDRVLQYLE